MDSIQEAMRQLMRREKHNEKNKQPDKNKTALRSLKEGIEAKRLKPALLRDLWDQVYCTLVDVGDNTAFEICNDGRKGKYNFDQVETKYGSLHDKYGNDVISVIYDKTFNDKPESIFFAEAVRVAKKYSLKTNKLEKGDRVYFNLIIPSNEPVYFDLIPPQFRERIAIENGEDFDNLPVSPNYEGILKIGEFEDGLKTFKYSRNKQPKIAEEQYEEEVLTEEFTSELPVTILSESEILDFIDSVPKATKDRGPASLTFTIGFATEVETASKFRENGRDHINKQTGEIYPTVNIVKCSEISGLYLERRESSKKTIAHNKQMDAYKANPEYEMESKREVAPWLDVVPEYRNLFKSKKTGELVLVPLVAKNSKTRTKYFISINGEQLRQTKKDEIVEYLTPAKQLELMNGREDQVKFGPDGKEIISPAQPLNFYLKKIYRIGNKGQSIF